MVHKAFIMFCGSSSVGKTTLVEQFPTKASGIARTPIPVSGYVDIVDPTQVIKAISIHRVEMSFRAIRAQIGNPSWEELQIDQAKGIYQQAFGMDLYNQRLYEKLENDEEGIFLFERCPYDIVGYSYAFDLPKEHIDRLQTQADMIMRTLSTYHKVLLVYRQVDWSFPYDRQDNARPDENIRRRCDTYCAEMMNYLHSEIFMPPNFKIRYSVNQDSNEIDQILRTVI